MSIFAFAFIVTEQLRVAMEEAGIPRYMYILGMFLSATSCLELKSSRNYPELHPKDFLCLFVYAVVKEKLIEAPIWISNSVLISCS